MQKTGKIDPVTGKEEYLAPDGSVISLSPEEFTRISSMASPPVNVDLNVGANYAGPPTTLGSAKPAMEAPSQLGLVTAGILGTDLATLEGRNNTSDANPRNQTRSHSSCSRC